MKKYFLLFLLSLFLLSSCSSNTEEIIISEQGDSSSIEGIVGVKDVSIDSAEKFAVLENWVEKPADAFYVYVVDMPDYIREALVQAYKVESKLGYLIPVMKPEHMADDGTQTYLVTIHPGKGEIISCKEIAVSADHKVSLSNNEVSLDWLKLAGYTSVQSPAVLYQEQWWGRYVVIKGTAYDIRSAFGIPDGVGHHEKTDSFVLPEGLIIENIMVK